MALTGNQKRGLGASIVAMIAGVIAVEGGWVNHPSDPGGETNMGITKTVAVEEGYRGSMRALPREVAESIYYRRYLVAPGFAPLAEIDPAVTEELFDTAVNMGPSRPSRWFQQSLNTLGGYRLTVDGKVGARTVAAFQGYQVKAGRTVACLKMLDALDGRQRAEYDRLVRVNRSLKVFHRGWINHRVGNVDRKKCR